MASVRLAPTSGSCVIAVPFQHVPCRSDWGRAFVVTVARLRTQQVHLWLQMAMSEATSSDSVASVSTSWLHRPLPGKQCTHDGQPVRMPWCVNTLRAALGWLSRYRGRKRLFKGVKFTLKGEKY